MSEMQSLVDALKPDAHIKGINRQHTCTNCHANTAEGLRTGIDINCGGQVIPCGRCMNDDWTDKFPALPPMPKPKRSWWGWIIGDKA